MDIPVKSGDSLPVSEMFLSLQGEGPSAGRRAVFLRLAFCNLKCVWCDSAYTWKGKVEATWMRSGEIAKALRRLWAPAGLRSAGIRQFPIEPSAVGPWSPQRVALPWDDSPPLLVITGGEPLLFQDRLVFLLRLLRGWSVEVETNGTIAPSPALVRLVCRFNVSPKLSNSRQPVRLRRVPSAIAALLASEKAFWKFVVCSERDIREINRWVSDFALPRDRVYLMPEGTTRSRLAQTSEIAADLAARYGYHFTHRLHILIWNGERAR
jgi:organic radical activating enzyme